MSSCPPNSESEKPTSPFHGVTKLYGTTPLYVAGPATASIGLLAYPNVFGPTSGRTKADADHLGALGYAVALVDVIHGEYVDAKDDIEVARPAFLKRQDFPGLLLPSLNDAVTYLQQEAHVECICSYGYCYGSWLAARFSAMDEPVMRGHMSFHPSWNAETMVEGEDGIPQLTKRIKVPQLLLSAGNDVAEVKEGGIVQHILSTSPNANVAKWSCVVDFNEVKHGWVNRGDLNDPTVKENVDKAWTMAIEFFRNVTQA